MLSADEVTRATSKLVGLYGRLLSRLKFFRKAAKNCRIFIKREKEKKNSYKEYNLATESPDSDLQLGYQETYY
jgi:hypothetical protein